jgi:hypothetical protein
MSTTEAFLLGMMAAWTPSLLILGWSLWPGAFDDAVDE